MVCLGTVAEAYRPGDRLAAMPNVVGGVDIIYRHSWNTTKAKRFTVVKLPGRLR